ncbi:polysaccharide pyruvyl transferase family protein [Mobilitalea sibirica]|uniref:Polysaccharide pyruvyl transferase family protein n=1 Tax=Mobilitalea sibirica TaxID=1462919 RepID=A0A8J7KUT6_9FIRM|nr:polysaccharide pyruvyl transferase family protein [Mobilitalea sibirica]MBH1939370.1 polysaccharide pyruvyl transferase family protein [Mobilitalea sibirica]
MMKQKLRVSYAHINNMGDLLNIHIIKKYFGYDIVQHNSITSELSGIGSGLNRYTLSQNFKRRIIQQISGLILPTVYIWGTGFISDDDGTTPFFRKNITFCALRGNLSKQRVEELIGRRLNIPTGDGGILASGLLDNKIQKRFELGIIPHFKEQHEIAFRDLNNKFKYSKIIDLKSDPIKVVKEIASCEYVISSSLHGLIIADSFNIPNQHIIVSDAPSGDGFKFKDYYSGYDLEHSPVYKNEINNISINTIIDNYKISPEQVNCKKNELIECFPFKKIGNRLKGECNEEYLLYSNKIS